MSDQLKLQKAFVEKIIQEEIPVSIYLVNGVQLKGHIEKVDDECLILKSDTPQIIFKHAISTIVPTKNVSIS
ncbi:MAG: RNA chaperone Hfq [Gammaproteobacteria bacterium]|nr:RNA chaperone Hfq [Gammaproteobacteria bacterium]